MNKKFISLVFVIVFVFLSFHISCKVFASGGLVDYATMNSVRLEEIGLTPSTLYTIFLYDAATTRDDSTLPVQGGKTSTDSSGKLSVTYTGLTSGHKYEAVISENGKLISTFFTTQVDTTSTFSNNNLGDVTVSVDDNFITSTTAKLKASGNITSGTYHFAVFEKSGYPANRNNFIYASGPISYPVTSNIASLEVTMTGLKSSTDYVGVLYKDSFDSISESNFSTKLGTTSADAINNGTEYISKSSVTDTTVALDAYNLQVGNIYDIYLSGNTAVTPNDPSYNKKVSLIVSDSMASSTFDGLISGDNYIAYIVKNGDTSQYLGQISFVQNQASASVATSTPATTTKASIYTKIVPECNTGTVDPKTGQFTNRCDFEYFMKLLNNIIKFLLFDIATPLIALILIYTGYLFMTAGGSAGQTEKAKHILFNVIIGYIIALAAWLIVNTIVTSLYLDTSINTYLDKSTLQQ